MTDLILKKYQDALEKESRADNTDAIIRIRKDIEAYLSGQPPVMHQVSMEKSWAATKRRVIQHIGKLALEM